MFGLGKKKKEEEMKQGVIFSTESENQGNEFSEELQKYKEEVENTSNQDATDVPTEDVAFEETSGSEEPTLGKEPVVENQGIFSKLFGKKKKNEEELPQETESEEIVKTEFLAESEIGEDEISEEIQKYKDEPMVTDTPVETSINEEELPQTESVEPVVEKQSIFSKLFGKKKKSEEGVAQTESEEIVKTETNTNIFEDFTSNAALKEDVKKLEENKNKDSSYYISLASSIIKTFNTVFLVLILVLISYVYVQKRETPLDFSFLNPICSFIIGDIPYEKYGNCEGVKIMKQLYAKDIEVVKEEQYNTISSVIGDIYTRENFLFSREVTFLIDKSRNRVAPLKVLAQFDKRKNQFEGIEKSRIQCKDIAISEDSILSMNCDAYSADWEKGFIGFDANKSSKTLEGTSITAANSFLNFLEMNAPEFALLNRQKNFGVENVTSEGYYTKKTSFKLELKFDRTSL